MRSPFADRERARLIAAILPDVPFDGWTSRALRRAAQRADIPAEAAQALFPGGAADLVAAFSHWADTQMAERLAALPALPDSLSERIALALRLRFEVVLPAREAVRRALSVLALPHNVPLGVRLLYDTVDAIWRAVGDRASDFSFYTKRASLAGILAPATLYWLDDRSPDCADTQAFIARRLAELRRFAELRGRAAAAARRLPDPLRLLRPVR